MHGGGISSNVGDGGVDWDGVGGGGRGACSWTLRACYWIIDLCYVLDVPESRIQLRGLSGECLLLSTS